jgi:hypothetical protein
MTTTDLKKFIKNLVESRYMNKIVKFDDDWKFRVKGYKIRERKSVIPRYEFEDYGVDEDTQVFIIVEFWDAKDESDATDAACVFFTLNSKGQVGTADVPFDFEVQGANSDLALKMCDEMFNRDKRQK